MIIWYTDKIDNPDLGYCLYLDLRGDHEFWYDYHIEQLYYSSGAGEIRGDVITNETGVTLRKRSDG